MIIVQFKRWRITCDPDATRNAYAKVLQGGPEECGCNTCMNFIAARRRAYPPEAIAFFEQLGIDITKEPEVYHNCRLETGLHSYGGWFHFIGAIEEGRDAMRQDGENLFRFDFETIADTFALGLTRETALTPRSFGGQPVVQIEFETQIPWVIASPEAE